MIPQVTKVVSDTSMRLGEMVPEEYIGVSNNIIDLILSRGLQAVHLASAA